MNAQQRSFAALCRAGRAILSWSQADLANKTNMATASIARIETGKINPRHDSVIAIIRALESGGLHIDRYDIDGGFSITADKSLFTKQDP